MFRFSDERQEEGGTRQLPLPVILGADVLSADVTDTHTRRQRATCYPSAATADFCTFVLAHRIMTEKKTAIKIFCYHCVVQSYSLKDAVLAYKHTCYSL